MDKYSRSDPPNHFAFPLASAGYPLVFASAFTTAVFALLSLTALALIGLAATFFICYFFRGCRGFTSRWQSYLGGPDGKQPVF